jgi:hypothetical protein
MSKAKHPRSRGERLRLKQKKDRFDSKDRLEAVARRHEQEAIEQREALHDLRKQVLAVKEESSYD